MTEETSASSDVPLPQTIAVEPVAPPPEPAGQLAAPKRPGAFRRGLNWFWRGQELRKVRLARREQPARAVELAARAEVLLELGRRAAHPAESLPRPAEAVAVDLYRQAVFFALRALAVQRGGAEESPWATLDEQTASRLAGSPERVEQLKQLVAEGDFTRSWETPKEERSHDAELLSRVGRGLIDELAWSTRARDALWLQRFWRIGLLVGVVAVIVGGLALFRDRSEQSRDLALGKPWRASSVVAGFGCRPPQQDCAESPDFFFHTNAEQNPWVEIDLGSRVRFSAVRVVNRKDCCFDRAVPLIVEISDDQQKFREVARRASVFSSWLATFAPKEARYVRVRVAASTNMHLAQLRVLR